MKKYFFQTLIFALTTTFVYGQTTTKKDSSEIEIQVANTYFIDGFKVYTKLTKADSLNILKDFVSKLNGCWTSKKRVHSFKLSNETFSGTWYTRGINSTGPFIRLEFINGQIKLIGSDLFSGDLNPRNIRVDEKTVTIEYPNKKDTFSYKRLKKCP